jgi:hypothetical protein
MWHVGQVLCVVEDKHDLVALTEAGVFQRVHKVGAVIRADITNETTAQRQ